VFLVFSSLVYSPRVFRRPVDHWLELKGKSDALLFLFLLFGADENGVVAVHYLCGLCDCFDILVGHVCMTLYGPDVGTREHSIVDHDRRVGRPPLDGDNAGIDKDEWTL